MSRCSISQYVSLIQRSIGRLKTLQNVSVQAGKANADITIIITKNFKKNIVNLSSLSSSCRLLGSSCYILHMKSIVYSPGKCWCVQFAKNNFTVLQVSLRKKEKKNLI